MTDEHEREEVPAAARFVVKDGKLVRREPDDIDFEEDLTFDD